MNDYYENLDDKNNVNANSDSGYYQNSGNGNQDSGYYPNIGNGNPDSGYYSEQANNTRFDEPTGVSTLFTVSYYKSKIVLMIIFMLFPIIVLAFSVDLLRGVLHSGNYSSAYMFVFTLVIIFLMFLFILLEGPGKKVEVYGNGITIRKWFIFSESITVKDVQKCKVITNLTVHTRYGSRTYNKLVLYYSNGHTVSLTDDVYENWSKLVAYMAWNDKNVHQDGTGRLIKYLAGKIDKMMKK